MTEPLRGELDDETAGGSPYPHLIRAALAACFACALSFASAPILLLARVVLLCFALVSAAVGVARGPLSWRVLLAAAGVVFLAQLAIDPAWDTVQLLLRIVLAVALGGAGLAALAPRRRKQVISGLVAFYFVGVVCAVLAAPHSPWLADQLRTRVYRPMLEFLHLTETYQWFAPETGPEPILWFRLRYADDTTRWVTVRDPADFPTRLEHTRWGSLTTWAHQVLPAPDPFPESWLDERIAAGAKFKPAIPFPPDDLATQYQEPTPESRFMLGAYARYVARAYPHPTDPEQAVTGVKIYGVLRTCREPADVAAGRDPLDPTLLSAYYQGEYDADGRLKPSCYHVEYDSDGHVIRMTRDPFLYWLIPIQRRDDGTLLDYVKVHAGDVTREDD